ncbi:MAG TPA: ABC transporter substrate-binding protein [Acidimicrobiales bacterium]|nr:ABC transporter substrate-binding protein [Acidimicrobiales bacterium]
MTRRRVVIVAAVVMAIVSAACSKGGDKSAKGSAAIKSAAPDISLASGAGHGIKIGLVVSGSGPGADVRDLAGGAYVAAYRLNGATSGHDRVELLVSDDNGTPEGATAAMNDLANKGAVGVVYASTGEQVLAGVATAAGLGLPVVLPYADDPRIASQGATAILAAPTIDQVAGELAAHVRKTGYGKVALLRQAGPYGDAGKAALIAAGIAVVLDRPFAAGDPMADVAAATKAAAPDAVVVWAEAGPALAMADALSAAGVDAALLFGDRVAVPAFGHGLASALAASVGDGVLSVGPWAGPDTPTAAVDAFYLARDRAVADGGVTADLSVADFRSHDAVLAIATAAASGGNRGDVLDGLRGLAPGKVSGTAGVPLDFRAPHALSDNDVALLSYSTIDDGSGRYPAPATAGGHWLAVAGTYTPPEALKGLDDPYGG